MDAGAGAVGAGQPLLDRLDDLVAVARLLAQQLQRQQAQVAVVEHAPAASTAAPPGRTAAMLDAAALVPGVPAVAPAMTMMSMQHEFLGVISI